MIRARGGRIAVAVGIMSALVARTALGQTVTLSVPNVCADPGATAIQVPIALDSAVAVRGLSFVLQDSPDELQLTSGRTAATCTDRTAGFTCTANEVTASNVGGESSKSSEVSATPQAPPSAPTGLAATAGNAQVSLTWNSVSGATSYSVYRSTTSGAETLVQSGLTVTTYTDTGRTNGTTYFYEVTASNVGGESAKSSEV